MTPSTPVRRSLVTTAALGTIAVLLLSGCSTLGGGSSEGGFAKDKVTVQPL